ncbi:unnamed protein product [Linum tenue]|uniref:Uncharacterized protein n=1 Tax=Linum tenue TaxID=586396 RepID=A0AAV0QWF8_9ROSI|nr:unnamed protein product [Linum tenue]
MLYSLPLMVLRKSKILLMRRRKMRKKFPKCKRMRPLHLMEHNATPMATKQLLWMDVLMLSMEQEVKRTRKNGNMELSTTMRSK